MKEMFGTMKRRLGEKKGDIVFIFFQGKLRAAGVDVMESIFPVGHVSQ